MYCKSALAHLADWALTLGCWIPLLVAQTQFFDYRSHPSHLGTENVQSSGEVDRSECPPCLDRYHHNAQYEFPGPWPAGSTFRSKTGTQGHSTW